MYVNPLDQARDVALAARGLPEIAFFDNSKGVYGRSPIVAVKRGENCYYDITTQLTAAQLNAQHGVSPAQAQAMLMGSMFGWTCKAADPNSPLAQA